MYKKILESFSALSTVLATALTVIFVTLALFTWTTHDLFHFKWLMGEPLHHEVHNKAAIYQERSYTIRKKPLIFGRSTLLARKADEQHLSIDYDRTTQQYILNNISQSKKVLTKNNGVTRYIKEWQLTAGDQFIFNKEHVKIIKADKNKLELTVNAMPFRINAKTFQVKTFNKKTQKAVIYLSSPWKQGSDESFGSFHCLDLTTKIKKYALYDLLQSESAFRIYLGGKYHCENNIPLAGIDYRAYMIEYRDKQFYLRPNYTYSTKKGDVFKITKEGKKLSIDEQFLTFENNEQILVTLGYSSYLLRFESNQQGQPHVMFKTINDGDIKEETIQAEEQKTGHESIDRSSKKTKYDLFSGGTIGLALGFVLNAFLWFFASSMSRKKIHWLSLHPKIYAAMPFVIIIFTAVVIKKILHFQVSDIVMMLWITVMFSLVYIWINKQRPILYFYLSTLVLLSYGILYSWHLQDLSASTKYYNDFKGQLFLILLGIQCWYVVICYKKVLLYLIQEKSNNEQSLLEQISPYLNGFFLLFLVWLWFGKIFTFMMIALILIYTLLFNLFSYRQFFINSLKVINKLNELFNRLLTHRSAKIILFMALLFSLFLATLLILMYSTAYPLSFNLALTCFILLFLSFSHNSRLLPYLIMTSLSISFIFIYAGTGSETGFSGIQPMEGMKLLFCMVFAFSLFLYDYYGRDVKAYRFPLFSLILLGITIGGSSLLTHDQSFLILIFWGFVFGSAFLWIASDWVSQRINNDRLTALMLFVLCMPAAFYTIVPLTINAFNHTFNAATGIARYAAWENPEKYPYSGHQYQYASCVYLDYYQKHQGKCYIGANEMLPRDIKIQYLSNVDDDFALTGFVTATNIVKNPPFNFGLMSFIAFQILWFMSLIYSLKPFINKSIMIWQAKIYGIFLCSGLGIIQAHILIAWGSNTGLLPVMGQPMTFLGRQGSHLLLFIFPFLYIVTLVVGLLNKEEENGNT